MYNTNWLKWVRENALIDLRLPRFLGWVYALIKPIRTIDDGEFEQLRDEITEQYRWNGTKASLEKLLNDQYDPIERRIYFENVIKTPVLYRTGIGVRSEAFRRTSEFEEYFRLSISDANDAQEIPYELKVFIHSSITFIPEAILETLELYLYAGIRPRLFLYSDGVEPVEIDTPFYTIIDG